MNKCKYCGKEIIENWSDPAVHYSGGNHLCLHCEILSNKKVGDVVQTSDGLYRDVTPDMFEYFRKLFRHNTQDHTPSDSECGESAMDCLDSAIGDSDPQDLGEYLDYPDELAREYPMIFAFQRLLEMREILKPNAEMAGRDSERYADEFVEPNGGK